MKNLVSALGLIIILTGSATAQAADVSTETGNGLASLCSEGDKTTEQFAAGVCSGFIVGVSVSVDNICRRANVTNGQVIKVARKYLDDHPEELDQPAQVLVRRSLTKAFPCPKPN